MSTSNDAEKSRTRKIIHVDMDAYYASVEVLDRPELKGKPLIVGGSPQSRAVVCSASYEARKFGVRSAMSCAAAWRLCPQAIFIPPRFARYSEISKQIHSIFQLVTPLVEPLSLDEAYLDVTQNLLNESSATRIAEFLRTEILSKTGLTASAGVAPNKFLAKLASDYRKPNGLFVIAPKDVESFLADLPVEKLWGVGPATAQKLHQEKIKTTRDLRSKSTQEMLKILGKTGHYLHQLAHGIDDRSVEPPGQPKSMGSEETLSRDTWDHSQLLSLLLNQSRELEFYLLRERLFCRTIQLKLKLKDFTLLTRSITTQKPIQNSSEIFEITKALMNQVYPEIPGPVRLVGTQVQSLLAEDEFLQLWLPLPDEVLIRPN